MSKLIEPEAAQAILEEGNINPTSITRTEALFTTSQGWQIEIFPTIVDDIIYLGYRLHEKIS